MIMMESVLKEQPVLLKIIAVPVIIARLVQHGLYLAQSALSQVI